MTRENVMRQATTRESVTSPIASLTQWSQHVPIDAHVPADCLVGCVSRRLTLAAVEPKHAPFHNSRLR